MKIIKLGYNTAVLGFYNSRWSVQCTSKIKKLDRLKRDYYRDEAILLVNRAKVISADGSKVAILFPDGHIENTYATQRKGINDTDWVFEHTQLLEMGSRKDKKASMKAGDAFKSQDYANIRRELAARSSTQKNEKEGA